MRKSSIILMISFLLFASSILLYVNLENNIDSRKDEILKQRELFKQSKKKLDTTVKALKEELVDLKSVKNRGQEALLKEANSKTNNFSERDEAPVEDGKSSEQIAWENAKDEVYKDAISYLEIEKLDLILPVFMDTSDLHLKYGAGVLGGTDAPNSSPNAMSVLAGHRGGFFGEQTFLRIDELSDGDTLKITSQNEELVYEYSHQEIISADDWSHFIRENDKSKIILMSCHPYPQNSERILITFYLKDAKKI